MEIKAIIIEDEKPAVDLLMHYLKDFHEIEITGSYSDGFTGLKAIHDTKPELVFLDIQMPRLTGLEIIELLDSMPHIIFTTAYDQFAIKAFEANAVDYLLKPFSKDRFLTAMNKVKDRILTNTNSTFLINKLAETIVENQKIERIAVRTSSRIQVIPVSNIFYFEADGDYVMIHSTEGKYLKEKTMKYFENNLDTSRFVRIHRSFIVNVEYITKVEYYDKDNHIAVLRNNEKLKISQSGYKTLRNVIHL
jgi:two-component system, LytTR family, response regulator